MAIKIDFELRISLITLIYNFFNVFPRMDLKLLDLVIVNEKFFQGKIDQPLIHPFEHFDKVMLVNETFL